MLLSSSVHFVLLAFGVLAVPVAGRMLAAERAGAVVLLWLIPIALTGSLADLALQALETLRPGSAFHAAPGGPLRLALAALVLLPPVEIAYQRVVTRMAGGGPHVRAPGTWGADATPTDPADDAES